MRQALATALTLWAVLAVALVLAVSRHPATGTVASQSPQVVVVRSANGKLTPVALPSAPAVHATTRTS
jgi:hypothetical protein